MNCPYCASELKEGAVFCENCGATLGVPAIDQALSSGDTMPNLVYGNMPEYGSGDVYSQADYIPVELPHPPVPQAQKQKRKKPHIALRIPLQLLSLVLALVLMVSVLATALVLDVSRLLSAGGIRQIVTAFFTVSQAKTPAAQVGAAGVTLRDVTDADLGGVEVPSDVLTSGDTEALVQWLKEVIEESAGEDVQIDEQQLQTFVEESTLTEYLADKASGYAEDFINGTQNTLITTEELMDLVEENQELFTETFQVELTPEIKKELKKNLEQNIEESNLNEVIHQQVIASVQESLSESLPIPWEEIQAMLQLLTSDFVQYGCIGLCVVLMLLILLLNFYNIPGGMAWSAVSCILAGAILALPVFALQTSPQVLVEVLNAPGAVAQVVLSLTSALALVHYGVLIFGAALLVLSIVLAIVLAALRQRETVAAF